MDKTLKEVIQLGSYIIAIVVATIAVNAYFSTPTVDLQTRLAVVEKEHIMYRDDVITQLASIDKRLDQQNAILIELLKK